MSTALATSYEQQQHEGEGTRGARHSVEIGVDEAGRGPLFGRVYAAAVILPKADDQGESFAHQNMKDSKRFSSKKKLRQVAQYIRDHPGVKYSIQFVEPDVIDCINIRQAVLRAMHDAIRDVLRQLHPDCVSKTSTALPLLMIDGNDFRPYNHLVDETWMSIPHVTVEGGDNRYTCIAAASILAKVAHDDYIADLCQDYPALIERYHLDKNVGYGTRQHLEGIQKYGITQWHRKSFARCNDQVTVAHLSKDREEFDETLP